MSGNDEEDFGKKMTAAKRKALEKRRAQAFESEDESEDDNSAVVVANAAKAVVQTTVDEDGFTLPMCTVATAKTNTEAPWTWSQLNYKYTMQQQMPHWYPPETSGRNIRAPAPSPMSVVKVFDRDSDTSSLTTPSSREIDSLSYSRI
jgi:hypothetical protein